MSDTGFWWGVLIAHYPKDQIHCILKTHLNYVKLKNL